MDTRVKGDAGEDVLWILGHEKEEIRQPRRGVCGQLFPRYRAKEDPRRRRRSTREWERENERAGRGEHFVAHIYIY